MLCVYFYWSSNLKSMKVNHDPALHANLHSQLSLCSVIPATQPHLQFFLVCILTTKSPLSPAAKSWSMTTGPCPRPLWWLLSTTRPGPPCWGLFTVCWRRLLTSCWKRWCWWMTTVTKVEAQTDWWTGSGQEWWQADSQELLQVHTDR